MEEIKFYSVNDKYGEFSNFALYPIKINGISYPSAEHYFQSQKFKGTAYEKKIIKAASPMKAAEMGRTRKVKMINNWDKFKDNIMYTAVYSKFTQYKELAELLVNTENAIIIEHTENDSYWGDGGNGKGKNKLGKILQKVRESLRSK